MARSQAEIRPLACAVNPYAAYIGTLPLALSLLTASAVNGLNQSAGPFVPSIPPPPWGGSRAWSAYAYTSSTAGTFSITAIDDGTTVTAPSLGALWEEDRRFATWPSRMEAAVTL